jgi:hypothetical protein
VKIVGKLLDLLMQVGLAYPLDYHQRAQCQREKDQEILEETFHLP